MDPLLSLLAGDRPQFRINPRGNGFTRRNPWHFTVSAGAPQEGVKRNRPAGEDCSASPPPLAALSPSSPRLRRAALTFGWAGAGWVSPASPWPDRRWRLTGGGPSRGHPCQAARGHWGPGPGSWQPRGPCKAERGSAGGTRGSLAISPEQEPGPERGRTAAWPAAARAGDGGKCHWRALPCSLARPSGRRLRWGGSKRLGRSIYGDAWRSGANGGRRCPRKPQQPRGFRWQERGRLRGDERVQCCLVGIGGEGAAPIFFPGAPEGGRAKLEFLYTARSL